MGAQKVELEPSGALAIVIIGPRVDGWDKCVRVGQADVICRES
jgi:hypothetical protein